MSNRKPAAKRQGRGTADVGLVQSGSGAPVPSADQSWRESTVEQWVAFWRSGLASQVEPSDLPALRRLYWLTDEIARCREAIEETGRVVAGSQGQPRPNPLYKQVSEFQAEARQLEDRFGLSPRARLQLGIALGAAHASLDALNERLQAKVADEDDLWSDLD